MNTRKIILTLMVVLLGISAKAQLFTVADSVLLFSPGDAGSKYYRIPALCTTAEGTVIAAADKRWTNGGDLPNNIDVVTRRSTDGGHTWENAITVDGEGTDIGSGDPALVYDSKRRTVLCIFTHGNGLWQSTPDNNGHIMVAKSTDDGRSWSRPVDINAQLYAGKDNWVTSFAGSGHAVQLRSGRLMFVIQVRTNLNNPYAPLSCYACFSDDGGDTWQTSLNAADTNGDEAKIVELSDGTLMMSIRVRNAGYHRKFSYSHDGGLTWSTPVAHQQIIEPACNGDVISYTRKGKRPVLLHTVPFHASVRCNVSLLASYNDGATWPLRQSIVPTGSGYSSITQLADGSIGCLVECDSPKGYKLWYYRLKPTDALTKAANIE